MNSSENPLLTIWGENLDREAPLVDYPRPQLVRGSYLSLNGTWECAFGPSDRLTEPSEYEYTITVPFSPEAVLSGVSKMLKPDEKLWYRRNFVISKEFLAQARTILHFGAVDERCDVYINGVRLGTHVGGYLPFQFDISSLVVVGENEIVVAVRDESDASYHSRGKQKMEPGGMWYTAQSGIWQSVWIENVPNNYIRSLKITPIFDDGSVSVVVDCGFADVPVLAVVTKGQKPVAVAEGRTGEELVLSLGEFEEWSPENPFLYDLIVTAGDDRVLSYFGMRKIEIKTASDGYPRIFLNNREYFCDGLLDQGYWPDGLYTAPSDEALIFDIETAKRAGFNTLRKHIKIEPLRWYYHCDRLGMLVWQDMVSGGGQYNRITNAILPMAGAKLRDNDYAKFGRMDERGREEFVREEEATIKLLYNSPSVVLWTLFNEGWGQFDALDAEERARELDPTRLIDHASGWHDQGGELRSLHIYFRRVKFRANASRPTVLSEFGGYSLSIDGHTWNDANYGYKKFTDEPSLRRAFADLYANEIEPAKANGLCAAIYTQLTDVEDECNGIMTYDRKHLKLSKTGIEGDL